MTGGSIEAQKGDKSDSELMFWKVAAGSVVGSNHESHGKNCEDAWAIARSQRSESSTEVVALCVCDGAGSAQHGGLGARITSRFAANYLIDHFEQFFNDGEAQKRCLIREAKRVLEEESLQLSAKLRSFACTIVAVACGIDGKWIAIHLGDGGIVAKVDGIARGISYPMKGEYSNQTFFVTDKDAEEQIKFYSSIDDTNTTAPSGFMVFSDGVERLLIEMKTGEIAVAASNMMDWLRQYGETEVTTAINSELIELFKPRTSDDCTIGILARVDSQCSTQPQERTIWHGPIHHDKLSDESMASTDPPVAASVQHQDSVSSSTLAYPEIGSNESAKLSGQNIDNFSAAQSLCNATNCSVVNRTTLRRTLFYTFGFVLGFYVGITIPLLLLLLFGYTF